jgi:hypothetical protein
MIKVTSIRWGANVELRGRESQRRVEGDGILYDEHTGNVEVDDGGCRAIVVPPQGTVIVLGERLQDGMHAKSPELKAVIEPPRSPASPDPPSARPIKTRR